MKEKTFKIINLILAIFIALFAIGYTFAWFSSEKKIYSPLFGGYSEGAYFAGGDGSAESPFILTAPIHLYNLAWLQDTGRLDKSYCFDLAADIDMGSMILPPIGTVNNPFGGVFDGGAHSISNLKVTTNSNLLSAKVVDISDFSGYVGMFGLTAETSEIKNLILNEPIIEVASENATYADSNTSVGLAIGYVANKASSIGVRGGTLAIRKSGYNTYNSILGAIAPGIESDLTGESTQGTVGGDTGLFIPQDIYKRIVGSASDSAIRNLASGTIPENVNSTSTLSFKTSSWIIPKADSGTNGLNLGDFSITFDEVTTNRIQVGGGGDIVNTSYINFYTRKGAGESYNITTDACTLVDLKASYDEGSVELYVQNNLVGFDGNRITELTHRFYFAGKPDMPPFNYAGGVYYEDGSLYTYGETSATVSGSLNVFTNSIKIDVVTDNAKIFVVAEGNKSDEIRTLAIYRMDDIDYSSPEKFIADTDKKSEYKETITNTYMTMDVGGTNTKGDETTKKLYACEFDLSKTTDASGNTIGGKGSYMLGSVSSGIGIYYVAVVGVAGGNASSGEVNSGVGVSAVDFIYKDVTIADGNFKINADTAPQNYQPTNVKLVFVVSGSNVVLYFFRDVEGDNDGIFPVESATDNTIAVEYNGETSFSSSATSSYGGVIGKFTPIPNNLLEVGSTVATFVLSGSSYFSKWN